MKTGKWLWLIAAAIALQGCASVKPKDNVIFLTKTSIGLDVDGTPPEVSFAYSRVEGFMGPRYDNGAVPPVASRLSTDGGIFNRNVSQFYATGAAASLVTGNTVTNGSPDLSGDREAMFFGTSTTLGVKMAFGATGLDGFVLGYRRKEVSVIPIGTRDGSDHYASVIGVLSTDTGATTPAESKLGISQYFATGSAADSIAKWEEIKASFRQSGENAFGRYRQSVAEQNKEVVRIYRCLARLDDSQFAKAVENANRLALFQNKEAYKLIKDETDPKAARARYIDDIGISIGASADRGMNLLKHRLFVCELLKQAKQP